MNGSMFRTAFTWVVMIAIASLWSGNLYGGDTLEMAAAKPQAAAAQEAGSVPPENQNLLVWLGHGLGTHYSLLFLLLTVNLVAACVWSILALLRNSVVPPALIQLLESRLADQRYQEASEVVQADQSLLARALAVGVKALPYGLEAAQTEMREVGSLLNMKIFHRLGYVALVAKLAPLLGLAATVEELISSLDLMLHRDVMPRPAEFAGSIATALIGIFVGLWITIVALTFYHVACNRAQRLVAEAGIIGDRLLRRFSGNKDF